MGLACLIVISNEIQENFNCAGDRLRSVNKDGVLQGDKWENAQDHFECNDYKFVGRQKNLLKG